MDLNQEPKVYETFALTVELYALTNCLNILCFLSVVNYGFVPQKAF